MRNNILLTIAGLLVSLIWAKHVLAARITEVKQRKVDEIYKLESGEKVGQYFSCDEKVGLVEVRGGMRKSDEVIFRIGSEKGKWGYENKYSGEMGTRKGVLIFGFPSIECEGEGYYFELEAGEENTGTVQVGVNKEGDMAFVVGRHGSLREEFEMSASSEWVDKIREQKWFFVVWGSLVVGLVGVMMRVKGEGGI